MGPQQNAEFFMFNCYPAKIIKIGCEKTFVPISTIYSAIPRNFLDRHFASISFLAHTVPQSKHNLQRNIKIRNWPIYPQNGCSIYLHLSLTIEYLLQADRFSGANLVRCIMESLQICIVLEDGVHGFGERADRELLQSIVDHLVWPWSCRRKVEEGRK